MFNSSEALLASTPIPSGCPFVLTMRWLGTNTGTGFLRAAFPTAR